MILRLLLSYHYFKDIDLDGLLSFFDEVDVFADSGAFSASRQGFVIDPRDYAAWINRWSHWFTVYANLDVIRDAPVTLDNQRLLEDWGLTPVPVFHGGENWGYLDQYAEDYSLIALGGIVYKSNVSLRFFVECMRRVPEKTAFHGFGLTAWPAVRDLPWYSLDSSNWVDGFKYGSVAVFDARAGQFHRIKFKPEHVWKHARLIRKAGIDPEIMLQRVPPRELMYQLGILSYIDEERWLRSRHGLQTIPVTRKQLHQGPSEGLRHYLAVVPSDVTTIQKIYPKLKELYHVAYSD